MCRLYAAVAQSVERILGKDEVGGSNPPSSSKILHLNLMVWVLFLMLSELFRLDSCKLK